VSPYEVARLARCLGISTTEFIAVHIAEGELERREDGTCIFLTEGGCAVHADRPYVCRLYPLMRHRERDGTEVFMHDLPHPQTEGRYGTDATVADWLEAQGIPPYLKAVEDYHRLFRRILSGIAALEGTEGVEGWPDDPREHSMAWMDIDAALGPPEPGADLEVRAQAHIRWIEAQLPFLPGVVVTGDSARG